LEFIVPFQHKYGYIRDEIRLRQDKTETSFKCSRRETSQDTDSKKDYIEMRLRRC